MTFRHNEVNFKVKYEYHRKCSKTYLWRFWRFSVTIICDIKIDLRECEPHCVKLNFLWTSFIVNIFDFLTFNILSHIHPLPLAPTLCHISKLPHPYHMPNPLPHSPPLQHAPYHMPYTLPHIHMPPPLPHVPTPATCLHPCHMSPPLPHVPTPATCSNLYPCHIPPALVTYPHPATFPRTL